MSDSSFELREGETITVDLGADGHATFVAPPGWTELSEIQKVEVLHADLIASLDRANAISVQAIKELLQYSIATAAPTTQPPLYAQRLLGLFLPREIEEAVLGDLQERFNEKLKSGDSLLWAKIWYWRHAIASAVPFLRALARGIFEAWRIGAGG